MKPATGTWAQLWAACPAGRSASSGSASAGVAYNWAATPAGGGLAGRTIGIVGLGEVGALVARLARALGMRVVYSKRRRAPVDQERVLGAEYATLADLLAQADFVVLLASDLPENERLADREFFAAMRPTAFFVHTSPGRPGDEEAL